MQLTARIGVLAAVLSLAAAPAAQAGITDPPTGSTLFRVFNDSEGIAVRSYMGDYRFELPRDYQLGLHLNNERVVIPGISAPVGSTEAIDAITTASRPISGNAYSDYIKVRNEVQGTLDRPHAGLEYYYSTERDYLGQQLGAHLDRDFRDQQLNLALGTSYGWDAISPLPDDDTRTGKDHKDTWHWNAVGTEVLSPSTLLRLGLEYNIVNGLQGNPYRNVFAGGTYVPERHPSHRERRDAFLKLNQWFTNRSSVRVSYRLYQDDWGILSHEVGSQLSQYVVPGLFAAWDYRWYTQSAASFASDNYVSTTGINGFLTGDYRLKDLSSHLFGFSLDMDFGVLAADVPALRRAGLRLDWERYFNSNNYSANILETGLEFRF